MNTASQTAPVTEVADRFRCESDVPDPPRDPAGRKQYWEDTVAEAVAELRRRLASTRDEKSFQALEMILDLEKTRLRHKAPVAGTHVGGGRWADGLEPLPVYTESDREFALKKVEAKDEDLAPPASVVAPPVVPETVSEEPVLPTSPRRGEVGCEATGRGATSQTDPLPAHPQPDVLLNTPSPERGGGRGVGSPTEPPLLSYPFPPKPAHPIPLHIRVKLQDGIHGHFHDHDDDWMLERGRGRRTRDTGAEVRADEPEEIDLEAVRRSLPPLPPLPRVRNFDLFCLRDEAVLGEPGA